MGYVPHQFPLLREHPLMFFHYLHCSISNYFLNFTREHAPGPSSDDSAFVSCLFVTPIMSILASANPGSVPEYFSGSLLECKLTMQGNVTGSVTLMTRLGWYLPCAILTTPVIKGHLASYQITIICAIQLSKII